MESATEITICSSDESGIIAVDYINRTDDASIVITGTQNHDESDLLIFPMEALKVTLSPSGSPLNASESEYSVYPVLSSRTTLDFFQSGAALESLTDIKKGKLSHNGSVSSLQAMQKKGPDSDFF